MVSHQPDQETAGTVGFERIRERVHSAKQELAQHFQSYHRMLYEKEESVLSELDGIVTSANDLYEKRRELKETQGDLEEKMKRNEFQAMKAKLLEVVSAELSEIERMMREVVELEWRDSKLFTAIQESCVVLKREPTVVHDSTSPSQLSIPYADRNVPLWSVGTRGAGDGQLINPRCVTVDTENDDIYVADRDNNRIAVFNRDGIFVRNLTVEGMVLPCGIVIKSEFCYISSSVPNGLILKVSLSTGTLVSSLEPGENMVAITLDSETGILFTCPLKDNRICYILPENLEKVSEVILNTDYFTKNFTQIYNLKSLNYEIYILFINCQYPLQSFSRDGNLLRTVIPQESVGRILYFCIDAQDNFVISDNSAHKVLIFSPAGELIATIGRDRTAIREPGELHGPLGVSLLKDRIVVCDGKLKNKLQLF